MHIYCNEELKNLPEEDQEWYCQECSIDKPKGRKKKKGKKDNKRTRKPQKQLSLDELLYLDEVDAFERDIPLGFDMRSQPVIQKNKRGKGQKPKDK